MLALSRRGLLVAVWAGFAASACARVAPRPPALEAPDSTPELDAWTTEARGMLSDALQALRTFDVFAAYRVSAAAQSGMRLPAMLAADPPTSAAWDEATQSHVYRRDLDLAIAGETSAMD